MSFFSANMLLSQSETGCHEENDFILYIRIIGLALHNRVMVNESLLKLNICLITLSNSLDSLSEVSRKGKLFCSHHLFVFALF